MFELTCRDSTPPLAVLNFLLHTAIETAGLPTGTRVVDLGGQGTEDLRSARGRFPIPKNAAVPPSEIAASEAETRRKPAAMRAAEVAVGVEPSFPSIP